MSKTNSKAFRYRDVLSLLKRMARSAEVTPEAIRAVFTDGSGDDAFTASDLVRVRALAASLKVESEIVELVEPDDPAFAPDMALIEIRRLHSFLRLARQEVATLRHQAEIAATKSKATHARRTAQMEAAGVTSVNEAFERLIVAETALRTIVENGTYGAPWLMATAQMALEKRSASATNTMR